MKEESKRDFFTDKISTLRLWVDFSEETLQTSRANELLYRTHKIKKKIQLGSPYVARGSRWNKAILIQTKSKGILIGAASWHWNSRDLVTWNCEKRLIIQRREHEEPSPEPSTPQQHWTSHILGHKDKQNPDSYTTLRMNIQCERYSS